MTKLLNKKTLLKRLGMPGKTEIVEEHFANLDSRFRLGPDYIRRDTIMYILNDLYIIREEYENGRCVRTIWGTQHDHR